MRWVTERIASVRNGSPGADTESERTKTQDRVRPARRDFEAEDGTGREKNRHGLTFVLLTRALMGDPFRPFPMKSSPPDLYESLILSQRERLSTHGAAFDEFLPDFLIVATNPPTT